MNRNVTIFSALAVGIFSILQTPESVYSSSRDDGIETSFLRTYVYRTYLTKDAIKIDAVEGKVTLTGFVSASSLSVLAKQTAASLPGVTDVNNQLKTDNEQAKKSDTQIGGRIRVTLLFHRNVNETATVIQVENGIVTLKGEAPYLAQKEMIAEYAADIDGVKKVKNEMTVAPSYQLKLRPSGVTMDDASVSGQVKTALLNHQSTGDMKIGVTTKKGVVTLTGIAGNLAEINHVSALVSDIRGVTGVKNDLTVGQN